MLLLSLKTFTRSLFEEFSWENWKLRGTNYSPEMANAGLGVPGGHRHKSKKNSWRGTFEDPILKSTEGKQIKD